MLKCIELLKIELNYIVQLFKFCRKSSRTHEDIPDLMKKYFEIAKNNVTNRPGKHCIHMLYFYHLSFLYARLWWDVLWYSVICPSLCLSVCPSDCYGLVGRTVSSRIIQLGTFDKHDERKMPIVFWGQRSKVEVIVTHSRKTL